MGTTARTFRVETEQPRKVVDALARLGPVPEAHVLLFVSKVLAERAQELAKEINDRFPTLNVLLVPAVGVLCETGETESTSAGAGMLLPSGVSFLAAPRADPGFGELLLRHLNAHPGASVCLLCRGDSREDGWLASVKERKLAPQHMIFGGGSLPGRDLILTGNQIISPAAVAAVVMSGGLSGRLISSCATRLLGPLGTVTDSQGPKLLTIDGLPALLVLEQCARELGQHPLVLLAVGLGKDPLSPAGRNLAAKPITGVDPLKGALLLSEEVAIGTQVAFAVRDPHTARTDLATKLRSLGRSFSGAAPHFGLYMNCAGRGSGLYGVGGVDVRLINTQFPNMPLIGLHSTFELSTFELSTFELSRFEDDLVHQVYAGVLGVFSAPS